MKNHILKRFLAACMAVSSLTVSLATAIPMTASAASSSLTISTQNVSFPSTNYGTYSFKNFKEAATGIPLWCIEPELDRVTGTYANKGTLTQSVIDSTYWSHENGTVNNYGKPTANEIYSILWHAANTEGLNLNNLNAWQQGGIQMAIKHWRVRNQPWGVKATAGSDADKAFQLAKRLHVDVWANTKIMQTGRASIAATYTGGGYISGSNYIIGTYTISGNYDSYTVEKDTGCAAAVVLTKSGNTVTASIPLSQMTGTYTMSAKLYASKAISEIQYYESSGSQRMGMFITESSGAETKIQKMRNTPPGSISITKKDSGTNKPLAGAEFKITNKNTGRTWSVFSEQNGIATQEDLPIGTYKIEEVAAPDGYTVGTQNVWDNVQITEGGTLSFSFTATNDPQMGKITVSKQDDETGQPILNAPTVFEVRAAQDVITPDGTVRYAKDALVDTITTAPNGKATTKALHLGQFYVTEKQAPSGYIQDTKRYPVTIEYGGQTVSVVTVGLTISNRPQMGQITVQKVDAETKLPITLSSATFEIHAKTDIITGDNTVRYKAGDLVDTLTTVDSVATSKKLYLGSYTVTEITAPDGYVVDTTPRDVTLTYGGQTVELVNESLTVSNASQMGTITIHKTDVETNKPITGSNAVFEIHAKTDIITGDGTVRYKAGELVDTLTTVDGVSTSKKLYLGTYTVTEKTAPDGYVVDTTPRDVTLTYVGQTVELVNESLSVPNVPQMGTITIQKTDVETNKPITGANAVFEIRAKINIVTGDGTVQYTAGELVDTVTTQNGIAVSKPLYLGSYTVTEKTAPDGYVVDTAPRDVTLTYAGQTVELVNESLTVTNLPQKGIIEIRKTDAETGKLIILSSATFEIYAAADIVTPDGTVRYTKDALVDTVSTAEGIARTKELYLGSYIVVETIAPEGYILDTNRYTATLRYAGQVAVPMQMDMPNVPTPPTPATGVAVSVAAPLALLVAGSTVMLVRKKRKS